MSARRTEPKPSTRAAPTETKKARAKAAKRERQRKREPGKADGTPTAPPASPAPGEDARWDWLWLAVVLLTAFTVRLVYVLQMQDSPLFEHPIVDARVHDEWAQAIAAGRSYFDGPYFRAPLYPLLLGAIYSVSDHSYLAPRIVQILLGTASAGLVFAIGRRLFDRRVATVAGLATATYWILVYFDGELLVPSLIVFLDLLLVLLLVRARVRPSPLAWGLAGVALGLSAIGRANVLLFAPAIVAWIWLLHRNDTRRALVYIAAITAGCLLAVTPVTVRNLVVGDDLVLIASSGGMVFYIGNNPDSDGMTAIVPGTPGDFWGGYRAATARAERARGRALSASEVSDYYFEQGRAFLFDEPAKAVALTFQKLRYFWTRFEIPNNTHIPFWVERFAPIARVLPLGFAVVGPLGLLGLVLCRRRALELFPLWGFVLVYMVSVVMFFVTARYRAPVLAPLILLGTWAVFQVVDSFREGGWRTLALPVAVLIPAALFVNIGERPGEANIEAISHESLAQAYAQTGDAARAEENHRHALRYDPEFLTARYNLATVLAKEARWEEAIAELERAVATAPRERRGESRSLVAAAHNQLGVALNNSGKREEAVAAFRRSIELAPDLVQTHRNLAKALITLDRKPEAIDALRGALALEPEQRADREQLADLLVTARRPREAIPEYEALLRATPNEDLRLKLAHAYGRAGEDVRAVEILRAGLAGAGPNLLNNLAWKLATAPTAEARDGAEAIRIASEACPAPPACHPAFLDTLAAAHAEMGDFTRARELAQAALEAVLASDTPEAEANAQAIRSHLASYAAGRPQRESE